MDTSKSSCSQFSFNVLDSFAADDVDPVQVKLFPRDESTGFDTSISVDILDSSIDSTSSEFDRFKDEQLCYLPATSTPLKPRIRPVGVDTGRVQYSEASESGTWELLFSRAEVSRIVYNGKLAYVESK